MMRFLSDVRRFWRALQALSAAMERMHPRSINEYEMPAALSEQAKQHRLAMLKRK